jgi:tetratricopeptide (TPR) repeat protein
MKRLVLCAFVSSILVSPSLFGQTNAPARDQLQQLVAQLQQSPGDQALREKIIALALTLNPKPATPDAVTMAEGAAEYAFKNAKSNSDFSDAAKQYEKALLLAPWLAADYFNCGVAHEKAAENKEAIASFNLYLLAAPKADDALAVKKRIGGLQYAAQKTEDEANKNAREAVAKQAVAPPVPVTERYECPTPQNERTVSQNFKFDFSTHRVIATIAWEHSSGDYEVPFEESGDRLILRSGCGWANGPDGCASINRRTSRLAIHAWGPNGGEDNPRGVYTGGPYIVEYACRVAR